MNGTSFAPLRWLVAPFGAVAAFVASQELFSIVVSLIKPTLLPSLVLWAVSDWCSTAFAMLTATEIAPRKKGMVALTAAVVLSLWHCALMLLAPHHPIAASYSHETICITSLGGFVIAALLAARAIRNEQIDIPGDELVEVMLKQLAQSRAQLEADFPDTNTPEFDFDSEVKETPAYKTDRDMILLERELRYINLQRTAYISAIRFAIAVERDATFQNCKGEHLFFHQIVLDSAMRLGVMKSSESFWKPTAHLFRTYENLTEQERRDLVDRTEALLPIEREPDAEPAESEIVAEQMLLEVTKELGLEPERQYAMNT